MRDSGPILLRYILFRIFPKRDCMAARDQQSAEIETSRVTDRHHSPVTVRVAPNACHHTAANLICEGEGSVLATPIGDAVADAVLAAFRSVDAKKPDTLAVDLDRVTLDDRCDSGDTIRTDRWKRQYHNEKEQYGSAIHEAFLCRRC